MIVKFKVDLKSKSYLIVRLVNQDFIFLEIIKHKRQHVLRQKRLKIARFITPTPSASIANKGNTGIKRNVK